MHARAADIYAKIFGDGEEEKGDGDRGFPPVSVNLAAAYAAAGNGDAALERFPAEDVRQGTLGNPGVKPYTELIDFGPDVCGESRGPVAELCTHLLGVLFIPTLLLLMVFVPTVLNIPLAEKCANHAIL